MSAVAITAVLATLRRLKNTGGLHPGHTSLDYLRAWAGEYQPVTTLRLAAALIEKIDAAILSVNSSPKLNDEAKLGLNSTLNGLKSAFSIEGFPQAVSNFLPAIDSSITNFSIMTSVANIDFSPQASDDIEQIVKEIDEFVNWVIELSVEPALREALVRQLRILTAMLRNAQAVGVDAALSSYFDLIISLRSTPDIVEAAKASKSVWDHVESWGDRISKVNMLVEGAGKAIPYLHKVPELLGFLRGS